MTNYTNSQQKVLDRINAAERGRNDYSVKEVKTNDYNNDLWVVVHNGEEHPILSESFYLTVGPRGGVTITGVSSFRMGDAQERWDADQVSCDLFNYAVFNGRATVKQYDKRPTKAEAVAAKQAAEERLATKAEAEKADAENVAQEAAEELVEAKPQLNEYYAVFTLSGELKLVEKLRDSHELEIEIYAYDLEGAKEQFKAHKKFLESEGLMDSEVEDDAEEADEVVEVQAERTEERHGYNGEINNLRDLRAYIDLLASDWDGEQDLHDFCHEQADGSEYHIYYGKAWQLVNMVRFDDRSIFDAAEDGAFNHGITFESADQMMTLIAYEVIYQELSLAVQELEQEWAA